MTRRCQRCRLRPSAPALPPEELVLELRGKIVARKAMTPLHDGVAPSRRISRGYVDFASASATHSSGRSPKLFKASLTRCLTVEVLGRIPRIAVHVARTDLAPPSTVTVPKQAKLPRSQALDAHH